MNENYANVLELCRRIIESNFRPCGLEEDIKNRIYELTLQWKRDKEKAEREGREIGGLSMIFKGLLKSWRQAEGLAKRWQKDVCYYLRMSLRNKWLEHYCKSMWK